MFRNLQRRNTSLFLYTFELSTIHFLNKVSSEVLNLHLFKQQFEEKNCATEFVRYAVKLTLA